MCLAIPGEVLSIKSEDNMMKTGSVSFCGVIKEINLSYTPQVKVGDYVLVHVGFAISIIDEDVAKMIFTRLKEMEEMQAANHTRN